MKHSVKNFLKLHSLFNIYLFILIPILILVVSECISFVFNFYSYKNLFTKNYASRLETLHDENMALLQNITSFAYSLSGNDDFMEYLALSDPVPIEDLRLKNQVKLLSNSHSFIDSMAIIKRVDDGFVYASDTIYPLSEYCSTVCNYADYPAEYWLSYTSPIQGVDFLPPTDVLNEEGEKYIYPIVYSKIGSKSLGTTLLVVNIDMQKIAQSFNRKLADHARIIFINNNDGSVYDAQDGVISDVNPRFLTRLRQQTVNYFYYFSDGRLFYAVSSYQKNSPFGYSYAITLPVTDLFVVHGMILIISTLLQAASLFIAFLSSKKLFNPWKLLASTLNTSPASSADADSIDRICNAIADLIQDKSSISEEFAKVLPLAQERYLINMLNSPQIDFPAKDEFMNFRFEYFCSIVIKLRPSDYFSDHYEKNEFNRLRNEMYNMLTLTFKDVFDSFVMPSENHSLYILLNLPDDREMGKIMELIHNFQDYLEKEKKHINLHIGIGSILKDLKGLKQSHFEAMNSISAIPGINTARLTQEGTETERISGQAVSMLLDFNAENRIYNNLIMGNVKTAENYILDIFNQNQDILSDRKALMQFYMQIYNIIFKAMKAKSISYSKDGVNDLDTMLSILSNTSLEIHETMLSMLHQLESAMPIVSTRADIHEIVAYINQHYTEEIYLDGLSKRFGISPSYLSKLIKEYSGMNFVSYLSSLRIETAKKMLLETKLSIQDIYIKSGFNNRTTFIRTFKNATGLSPSAFRKLDEQ